MIERRQVGGGRMAERDSPAAGAELVNGAHDPRPGPIAEKLPESGRHGGAFSLDTTQSTAENGSLYAVVRGGTWSSSVRRRLVAAVLAERNTSDGDTILRLLDDASLRALFLLQAAARSCVER